MSAYLDGDLGAHGRARVERHASRCPECREVLQSVREMLDLLRAQPRARRPVPADLVIAVRARLAEPGG
jgi:anti-sigma factor RsiW